MELGLSLGEAPPPHPKSFSFIEENSRCSSTNKRPLALDLGFCMALGPKHGEPNGDATGHRDEGPSYPSLQLDLMPFSPVPRQQLCLPWPSEQGNSEESNRCFDVNMLPSSDEQQDEGIHSSPTSALADGVAELERASSRISDDDDNGLTRKKLRLSREQSAYLEESFKEHNTLNPKQKIALAKQLNLRPRQVEVWFQNRRARTKLKQTEVDCEYLKRSCEKLTEENRRLQKELQELRALKTAQPFYMHLPATTLTMCPSCERVASTTHATAAAPAAASTEQNQNQHTPSPSVLPARPRFYPFVPQPDQNGARA